MPETFNPQTPPVATAAQYLRLATATHEPEQAGCRRAHHRQSRRPPERVRFESLLRHQQREPESKRSSGGTWLGENRVGPTTTSITAETGGTVKSLTKEPVRRRTAHLGAVRLYVRRRRIGWFVLRRPVDARNAAVGEACAHGDVTRPRSARPRQWGRSSTQLELARRRVEAASVGGPEGNAALTALEQVERELMRVTGDPALPLSV